MDKIRNKSCILYTLYCLTYSDKAKLWQKIVGSSCGSVGKAVASDSRGPRFKSSHSQNLCWPLTVNCIEKTKIKKKRPGMAHFFKKKCRNFVESISQFFHCFLFLSLSSISDNFPSWERNWEKVDDAWRKKRKKDEKTRRESKKERERSQLVKIIYFDVRKVLERGKKEQTNTHRQLSKQLGTRQCDHIWPFLMVKNLLTKVGQILGDFLSILSYITF